MRPGLLALTVLLAAATTAIAADEGLQSAKVVSIKNYPQGRIVQWEGYAPIFDGDPVYDLTLYYQGKKYTVRYNSLTGYYPPGWKQGSSIKVERKRGLFILYNGTEPVKARQVSASDCINASFPPSGPYVSPEVACD